MFIAIAHYHHKHGVDSILFITNAQEKEALPPVDQACFDAGVVVEEDEDEYVEWYDVRDTDHLPEINEVPAVVRLEQQIKADDAARRADDGTS